VFTLKFNETLKKLRKQNNLTQDALSKQLNVSKSTISMYENGERIPPSDMMEKIADFFNISINTLYGREESKVLPSNIFPIARKQFRMLGSIACGEPRYADEDHETYIEASADIQADFCLRAKGDSMIGARIQDGDIVFIREQPIVEDGEIAAVIIDNEATLKRVKYNKEKQQLTLFPANDKYDPLVFIGEELNQIRILGKAVCFMSNL
jgi:repressor LexA